MCVARGGRHGGFLRIAREYRLLSALPIGLGSALAIVLRCLPVALGLALHGRLPVTLRGLLPIARCTLLPVALSSGALSVALGGAGGVRGRRRRRGIARRR